MCSPLSLQFCLSREVCLLFSVSSRSATLLLLPLLPLAGAAAAAAAAVAVAAVASCWLLLLLQVRSELRFY